MSKVRVELDRQGVRNLLKSPEMKTLITEKCNAIQSRAGNGYETDVRQGSNRIQGRVHAGDVNSYYDNLNNNTLLKSLR